VFDDQLRDELLRRYDRHPTSLRPEHYLVATNPDPAQQRALLNEALRRLPEPGRSKLGTRLLKDRDRVPLI